MAQPLVLYAEPGDPSLLPVLITEAVIKSGSLITAPFDKTATALAAACSPFPESSTILLKGPNGCVLTEPVAIARYISQVHGASSDFTASKTEQLIEWSEVVLAPAVTAAVVEGKALPGTVLSPLKGGKFVAGGEQLSLADIAIWWRLLPLAKPESSETATWCSKLASHSAFQEAITAVGGGGDLAQLVDKAEERVRTIATAMKPAPVAPQSSSSTATSSGRNKNKKAAPTEGSTPALKSPYLEVNEVRAPAPGKRNVMVTSALPYVNNVPHLGNIIGCVLSADVFARYCRRRGYNVIYMCGTDEYGTATETKAMEEGVSPREICDKYHEIHKEIYNWFDISFDKFGRTSTPKQTEICQAIFHSLVREKRLIEDTMEQPYCDTCKRFLADRFVEGICPHCKYDDARGDQCDKCGKLLNPADLLQPRCKVCSNAPRIRQTEHMFLDLPELKGKLEEYINKTSVVGGWSANAMATTNSWIRDGLKPRCITRDLKWGVPVPLEKYKEKVFYVWFDAPIGYISITANYSEGWEEWWKSPDDVELVQFMGKDNVPFHTVIFPSTLLGTSEPWTLMKTISVTEYLNYEDGKFSKSRGVGVFGNDAKSTGIPAEVWRYYLLINRPEVSDTVFTWSDLQAKNNNELIANLGNFVHRVLSFTVNKLEGKVPEPVGAEADEAAKAVSTDVHALVVDYVKQMEQVKLKDGLKIAMSISARGNKYLQDTEFFKLLKSNPAACAVVVATSLGLVRVLTALLEPYMPSFAYRVLAQLNLPTSALSLTDADVAGCQQLWKLVPGGHAIGVPAPIFTTIEDAAVAENKRKFAGNQADRLAAEQQAASKAGPPSTPAASDNGVPTPGGKKGGKKEAAPKAAKAKEPEKPLDVSRLDIRVGRITTCKKHPDADSLYVEEIDVGEDVPRTVVSGLVKFVPLEEMQNRLVCVMCNLKPVAMRGIKSHAMVLAASNADHTQVELVSPPAEAKVGEAVKFPGYEGAPDEQLNPKKKVWESVQPDFKTGDDGVAFWKDAAFTTSAGVCTVKSITGGSIA